MTLAIIIDKFNYLTALFNTLMSHLPIILFDFDGVIITHKSLEYTASIFLKNEFYKWKNIENMRLIDFARLFEEADSENKILALKRIIKIYKEYIPSRWRRVLFIIRFRRIYPKFEKYETLKPNLEEILRKLKKSKIPLAIVSNTSGKRLNRFRQKLNLDKYISIFISRDDTPFRKPSAYPIYIALRKIKENHKFSINKELVYYVGDLPQDVLCAKNAKINSIALLSGHGTKESLEKVKPTFLFQNIKDIVEIGKIKKFLLN
ncbi:MAG: HAD family hydrolase [Promethearchaeota archaeon]